jgi:hypothetical protein
LKGTEVAVLLKRLGELVRERGFGNVWKFLDKSHTSIEKCSKTMHYFLLSEVTLYVNYNLCFFKLMKEV